MSDRERTDDGTFQETVTLDAVRGVFDTVRGPVITSSDVSDALDCTTEAARQKLARLYDRGDVDRRKTGRTVVYWRTDSAGESGRESAVTPSEAPEGDASESQDTGDTVAQALEGWQHGRSSDERAASRQIAEQATAWLRDSAHDSVRRGDVPLDEFADADPEGRTADTLWSQVVRDAWQHAADRGYITRPHSRAYEWDGDGEV